GALARRRLGADAARWDTPRNVLVTAIETADGLLAAARAELSASSHTVTFVTTDVGSRGRFENLNALVEEHLRPEHDWLLILDDDVELPRGFLDRFLFLAERFDLSIAQPAHRAYSHAAWPVTRRRSGSLVRETAFVEIGPVVAFRRDCFESVLPFPALRVGWGVDAYWGALAQQEGWRIGVVDAAAIEHALRPVAASYDRESAHSESQAFLATHPHISAAEAGRTFQTHRRY
ncbi:MAG: hypothetical protein J2O48_11540, partial [Solirubrobacterales bacterium]|nr:hypothetical protein [Solirubrobacterales bacterium]